MLAQFVLQLITGISLMWVLMPRRQVASGFFRIQMLIVLGLSVLAAVSAGQLLPYQAAARQTGAEAWNDAVILVWITSGVLAILAYCGSVFWTLERRKAGGRTAFIMWGLANLALDFAVRGIYTPNWLGLFSSGATASVLGAAVTAMLLGHWYLTVPTMSIQPLHRLTVVLLVSLIVRAVASGICWSYGSDALTGSLVWTWWTLRCLAGIALPLVLGGMTLRILRYRNTQAATGVLFAIVILTFIGEMSSALLGQELGRPF